MKKFIYLLTTTAVITTIIVSCNGGTAMSGKAVLKNETDSVSYASGVVAAGKGLNSFLEQNGILSSTSEIRYSYQSKIDEEKDSLKKEGIKKEMESKIAAIQSSDSPKIKEFMKGLNDALNQDSSKAPYNTGFSVGQQIKQQMIPQLQSSVFKKGSSQKIDNNLFLAGILAEINDKDEDYAFEKTAITQYIESRINANTEEQKISDAKDLKAKYQDSIAAGDKFMAENAKKQGVKTLPNGLQYSIIKIGKGNMPKDGDKVKVNYIGTLINGKVFDSSIKRGEPAVFNINQVIKGWTEILKLMPIGSKWKVYIPYNLAYGENGAGEVIPPFANLIFEIELLSIEK